MIIKAFDDTHLNKIENDMMTIFLLGGNSIRGAFLNGSRMINQMKANHETGIMESLILGHAYLAAGLLISDMKGKERISIKLDTLGPIRGLLVESNSLGEVRGYLKNSQLEISPEIKSLDTAPYIGQGFLLFSRHIAEESSPFTGQVVLQYSTIAKDLAYYFLTSEQRPSAFNLSVFFGPDGIINGAGGLFLQVLPDADIKMLDELSETLENMASIGSMLAESKSSKEIITKCLGKFSPEILAHRPVVFHCGCSKERFGSFIAAMDKSDVEEILEKGPFPLETQCHNCNSNYAFSRDEIALLTGK
ncbi:MAG: Hsp33 family molecular chaperone HslO [Spirochaetales bacterium]|nr:Hsp33 family molecular chaperone HslO [Spirochaetales bacterium]